MVVLESEGEANSFGTNVGGCACTDAPLANLGVTDLAFLRGE